METEVVVETDAGTVVDDEATVMEYMFVEDTKFRKKNYKYFR